MIFAQKSRSDPLIRQAGAIVLRRAGDAPEVLLVRGTRQPFPWVFPKGHIDAGETPEQAAGRELREEAGVVGALVARVGHSDFVDRNRSYHVVYYLFQPLSTNNPHEPRMQGWFKEEGVDIEFKWLEYAPSMEAFSAGKVDAVCMTNGDAMVTGASGKTSTCIVDALTLFQSRETSDA